MIDNTLSMKLWWLLWRTLKWRTAISLARPQRWNKHICQILYYCETTPRVNILIDIRNVLNWPALTLFFIVRLIKSAIPSFYGNLLEFTPLLPQAIQKCFQIITICFPWNLLLGWNKREKQTAIIVLCEIYCWANNIFIFFSFLQYI